MNGYKICSRCIMDNISSPNITFDDKGVCCYCNKYDDEVKLYGYKGQKSDNELKQIVTEIKEFGKGKEYDCILGISGGVDSAYIAYLAKKLDLRILAVHVDAGWNSDIAVNNIQKMCKKLNIDLHTIVCDWSAMKELQRAFMFSGLPDLDIPQDHAFLAGVYEYAKKNGIRYMLNGSNMATEGILPENFGHLAIDFKFIKSVYKTCGRGMKIFDRYPHFNLFEYYHMQKTVQRVNLLNYIPYSQKEAIQTLQKEFDWNYYGGKHFESRFTKFFQSYYLTEKFHFDKKRAHLSSLIVGGEMTREEALKEIQDNSGYPMSQKLKDRDYIIQKLDISLDEWDEIMKAPIVSDNTYAGNEKIIKRLSQIKRKLFESQREERR